MNLIGFRDAKLKFVEQGMLAFLHRRLEVEYICRNMEISQMIEFVDFIAILRTRTLIEMRSVPLCSL